MTATTASPAVKIAQTPPIPTFKTPGEERLHRKQRLASAFRLFAKFGFSEGVAGHITVRDPELADHFWVNPFGMHFAHIRVSDLVLVDEKGQVVEGNRLVNESAFAIHSRVHMARPDVVAAAHAHSLYGKTWSSLGRLLDPSRFEVLNGGMPGFGTLDCLNLFLYKRQTMSAPPGIIHVKLET